MSPSTILLCSRIVLSRVAHCVMAHLDVMFWPARGKEVDVSRSSVEIVNPFKQCPRVGDLCWGIRPTHLVQSRSLLPVVSSRLGSLRVCLS